MTGHRRPLAEIETPALWVHLDRLDANIQRLARFFAEAGVHWRPHVKGLRVPAIARRVVDAGAIGMTCATVGEAAVMADSGITDLLIANQVVGPQKTERLACLQRNADVKAAVDSEANIAELGAAGCAAGTEIGVVVELNVGMNRAGIAPGPPALELARLVHDTPGLRLRGLMGWEGHTRPIEDLDARREAILAAMQRLTDTATLCRDDGLCVDIVSAGGSGTHYAAALHPGITEIQAGGAVFCCTLCVDWGVETEPALFVRGTVTSRPAPDRIIVDAGFKTLPSAHAAPRPVGLTGVREVKSSAEHGVFELEAANDTVRVGDQLDFFVGYGDATVFLHDRLHGVRNGAVETVWEIPPRARCE